MILSESLLISSGTWMFAVCFVPFLMIITVVRLNRALLLSFLTVLQSCSKSETMTFYFVKELGPDSLHPAWKPHSIWAWLLRIRVHLGLEHLLGGRRGFSPSLVSCIKIELKGGWRFVSQFLLLCMHKILQVQLLGIQASALSHSHSLF